jgi:hypothetical protein
MNANIRYGEEDDIQNLTDYLAGYSLKPWYTTYVFILFNT